MISVSSLSKLEDTTPGKAVGTVRTMKKTSQSGNPSRCCRSGCGNRYFHVGSGSVWANVIVLTILVSSVDHTNATMPVYPRSYSILTTAEITKLIDTHVEEPTLTEWWGLSKDLPCTPTGLGRTLTQLRAGDQDEYDEEELDDEEYTEDEDDDEEDGDDDEPNDKFDHHLVRPPPRQSSSSRGRPPRQGTGNDRYDYKLAGPGNRRQSSGPKRKQRKHWSQRLVAGSVKFTGNVALNTVKQSGKLAYNIVRPKHVDEYEIDGLWRLDQQIVMKRRRDEEQVLSSVATIQIDTRRHVIVVQQHGESNDDDDRGNSEEEGSASKKRQPWVQPYRFDSTRLGSYQSKFVARAFLVGKDQVRIYGYKGTWQRKVADKKVLKLVGKIYNVKKLNPRQLDRLQRSRKAKKDILGTYQFVGKSIGTFVGRRRVQLVEDDTDDLDGEYDDEDGWEDVDEDDNNSDDEYDEDDDGYDNDV